MNTFGQVWFITAEAIKEIKNNFKNLDIVSKSFLSTNKIQRDANSDIKKYGNTAIIEVSGILAPHVSLIEYYMGYYDYSWLIQDIKNCIEDSSINNIILDLDSPGGVGAPMFEVSGIIKEMSEIKPIYAWIGTHCCSAAYGLASACKRIYSSVAAEVGSVGTMLSVPKQTAPDQEGVMTIDIVSDDSLLKNADPTTPDGIASYKRRLNSLTKQFLELLANNRNLSFDYVKNSFGKGEVFAASEALDRKMIDEISTFDDLLSLLNTTKKGGSKMAENKEGVGIASEKENTLKMENKNQYADINTIKAEAIAEERKRIKALSDVCVAGNVDAKVLAEAISTGKSVDQLSVELIRLKETTTSIDSNKNLPVDAKDSSDAYMDYVKQLNNK